MLSHIREGVTDYLTFTDEGRKELKVLLKEFRSCKSLKVSQNEFKDQLKQTKWFKVAPYKDNDYLNHIDPDEFITFDKAFADVANILGWTEKKKAKVLENKIIEDLCF